MRECKLVERTRQLAVVVENDPKPYQLLLK
jgi:hypothetical protein